MISSFISRTVFVLAIGMGLLIPFGASFAHASLIDELQAQVQVLRTQLATFGEAASSVLNFAVGGKIVTSRYLNVRNSPGLSASIINLAPIGSAGTVLAGPVSASGHAWYKIAYDNNPTFSGWSSNIGLAQANISIGSLSGRIKIKRVGSDLTVATAPPTSAWIDALPPSMTNVSAFQSVTAGAHTAYVSTVPGYSVRAGVCTKGLGTAEECSVTSFPLTPICIAQSCSVPITLGANELTKMVFQYILSPVTSLHRIGTRTVPGSYAEFYDTVTGATFTPRGNNYIRLDGDGAGHATFNPGLYDATRAEAALTKMQQDGYNIVRVFFDHRTLGGALTTPGVDPAYMANVIDFLRRSRKHNLYVVLTASWSPASYTSVINAVPTPKKVDGVNRIILHPGNMNAQAAMWKDVINAIKIADANLLEGVFGYDLWSELSYYSNAKPFSLATGLVTLPEGGTYDMSDTVSRQLAADNSAKYWANQVSQAIKGLDPKALTTISLFAPISVARQGYDGVKPVSDAADPRAPVRLSALAQSSLDYLVPHAYPGAAVITLADEMKSFEMSALGKTKPFLIGEYGAFKMYYPDLSGAALALRDHQIASCAYGIKGWLLWDWDTIEQSTLWNALDGNGAINSVLAPVSRPDPCGGGTSALGRIKILRRDQNLALISGTVSEVVGLGQDSTNELDDSRTRFLNVAPGTYTVRVTDLPDKKESYGICTRALTSTVGCSVTAFSSKPVCDGAWCVATILVLANTLTKVDFQYNPIVAPLHRIGVRTVPGSFAEFYDTVTGATFTPRGNNYIRLSNVKNGHSTFNPGAYDSAKAEAALAQMHRDGYNTVRVYLNSQYFGGNLTQPGLDPVYMGNVVDFLRRATNHGMYVVLTGDTWLPPNYNSLAGQNPPNVEGVNGLYMSQGAINAAKAYWKDILSWIKTTDPNLLSSVFGYDVATEASFQSDQKPFSLSSGLVTPADGGTYDMSNAQSRQLAADNSAIHWANQITKAIKNIDPSALVSASLFPPNAAGRSGYDGVAPVVASADPRAPLRLSSLYQSAFGYIDLHAYPLPAPLTLDGYMQSFELSTIGTAKPRFMGEFGAFKSAFGKTVFGDVTSAAYGMRDHQAASCSYGFKGWLFWTWDTSTTEQPELWNALDGNGTINSVLAPRNRPDPCGGGTSAIGRIKIIRRDQNLALISGTVSEVVGLGQDSTNELDDSRTRFLNVAPGTYTVRVTDLPDKKESYGICTRALTSTVGCSVTAFPLSPVCDGAWCTATISVLANTLTKVDFQYVPVPAGKPNIVVIMTDDQDDKGSMSVMPKTRRLLGENGVTFSNSFVDDPICCPSRASFMSGQYVHNNGIWQNGMPNGGYGKFRLTESDSLSVWLQQAGYNTALIGKYLNGYGDGGAGGPPTAIPPGWSAWHVLSRGNEYYNYWLNENGIERSYGSSPSDYLTDVLSNKAASYIESRAGSDQPFFLWLTPKAPHTGAPGPGAVPAPRHKDIFSSTPLPLPPSFNEADLSDKPPSMQGLLPMSAARIDQTTRIYQTQRESLLAVDDMVENVVMALKRSGKLDNTIIMFTSDNGFFHGEHRLPAGKVLVYEEAIRVPLLVRGPGIPQNTSRSQLVSNIDLTATIVDAAGARATRALDGKSIMPVAQNPQAPWRSTLLVEGVDRAFLNSPYQYGRYQAVRTNRFKYVEHMPEAGVIWKELYDLSEDPYELSSQHQNVQYAPIMSALSSQLQALRTCQGASCWMTTAEPLRGSSVFQRDNTALKFPVPPFGSSQGAWQFLDQVDAD